MKVNQNNFNEIKEILETENQEFEIISLQFKEIKNKNKTRKRGYLEVRHKICGRIFLTPIAKLKILNCPKCVYKKKSSSDFEEEFKESSNGEYILLSEYKKVSEKVLVKHLTCGHTYEVSPNKWLSGRRCPNCNGPKRMNPDKFHKIFNETSHGEYELLDEYKDTHTKIKIKHLTCGHTYEVSPNKWLSGRRCPKCRISKGELEIKRVLTELNISFEQQFKFKDCKDILPLPFDFIIYKGDTRDIIALIEFDGWQHFSYSPKSLFNKTKEDLDRVKRHDDIKNNYCKENKIQLIRIRDIQKVEETIKKMFNDYPLGE